jgi:hypothetical protein
MQADIQAADQAEPTVEEYDYVLRMMHARGSMGPSMQRSHTSEAMRPRFLMCQSCCYCRCKQDKWQQISRSHWLRLLLLAAAEKYHVISMAYAPRGGGELY